jgi:hypothetical protein
LTLYHIASGTHTVRVTREHHQPFEARVYVPQGGLAKVDAVLKPRIGRLMVDTVPYASSVALDGKLLGKAPLSLEEVPEGPHVVTVKAEGQHALTRRIEVKKDRTTVCEMNLLQPKKSFYRIVKMSKAPKTKPEKDATDDDTGLELVPLVPVIKDDAPVEEIPPEPKPVVAAVPAAPAAAVQASPSPARQIRTRAERPMSTRRKWAWVSAGTAAAAGVTSLVLFLTSTSTQADADAAEREFQVATDYGRREELQKTSRELDDRAAGLETGAWICAGASLLAVGTSLYLFLSEADSSSDHHDSDLSLRAHAMPGGGWVGLQGRF